IDLDVLEHTKLTRADTRTGRIGAFAPDRSRAEAQLHVRYSFSKAALASPWQRGRHSRPGCRGRLPNPENSLATSAQSADRSRPPSLPRRRSGARHSRKEQRLPRKLRWPSRYSYEQNLLQQKRSPLFWGFSRFISLGREVRRRGSLLGRSQSPGRQA